jgi:hypothetical protein
MRCADELALRAAAASANLGRMPRLLPLGLLLCSACAGHPGHDDTDRPTDTDDTDVVSPTCAWDPPPLVEFARSVAAGMPPDGTPIEYGNPPQGGAPYAPFEVRLHAEFDTTQRIEVSANAVDTTSGEELGTIVQPQVFLCANAGPHAGWLYGGEVHVRFWDRSLEELEGKVVKVTLSVALPDGAAPVVADTSGALTWVLGRDAAADGGAARD